MQAEEYQFGTKSEACMLIFTYFNDTKNYWI